MLVHLWLARVCEVQVVDTGNATDASSKTRKLYEALFSLCKKADPDFSPLQAVESIFSGVA